MTIKASMVAIVFMSSAVAIHAQVNSVITDGRVPFSEGILKEYVVQSNGLVVCTGPYVIGRFISCLDRVSADGTVYHAENRQRVWADTNGTLGALIVVDEEGVEVCRDPSVWNEFRGPLSYIVCDG